MKESWFRVHTSILDSRKFEGISLAARGLWVTLGALAKERDCAGKLVRRDGTPMDVARIAREIGYPIEEVQNLLDELVAAGLIDVDGDGAYCLHDWDEWQTREEERERWRAYKRQKDEVPTNSNDFQQLPRSSNEFQSIPTTSNEFQEVPTSSNEFQRVPTSSNEFQKIPLETKTKTKTKSENKTRIEYAHENFSTTSGAEKKETVVERVARIMGLSPKQFPDGCDQWLIRYVTEDVSDEQLAETYQRWLASGNDPHHGGKAVYRWVVWLKHSRASPRASPEQEPLRRVSLLNDPEYVKAVLSAEVVSDGTETHA